MLKMETPCISYVALYLVSAVIWSSHTKCATHWRFEHGKVHVVAGEEELIWDNDPLFRILASNSWQKSKNVKENMSVDVIPVDSNSKENPSSVKEENINSSLDQSNVIAMKRFQAAALTCGEPVIETPIDHLEGIAERFSHPVSSEPEVALLFRKNEFDNVQTDVIEVNLIDALKSSENKLILFNQIGNFLRIKGDTYHAIECFRSALVISYNNADILLNLARLLLNLNYIKDALYLVEHSLDQQSAEQSTWLQHFTLGEILERNGELERALSHFQMALDENPAFHPAKINIKNLGNVSTPVSANVYTFCIISVLCFFILTYVYFTIINEPDEENNNKDRRSFIFKNT